MKFLFLILYNLLLYYHFASCFEASICIGICHCNRDTVDCSSLDLAEIPSGIPNNTRVLILSDNEIETIDDQNLKYFHFLHTIDLSNNILRQIDPNFFKNVPNLRVINLRKNRFSLIPSGLHYLDNIEKLDLRSNLISRLEPNEFNQLAAVRHVDLSRNLISSLPAKTNHSSSSSSSSPIFQHLSTTKRATIEKLDLASNSISDIPSDVFLKFTSLVSLRLSRNRIHSLKQFTFSRLPQLELIDLTRNLIREIRFLAFNQLPMLKNVTLARNDIFGLDDGMFYACENLARLNLSNNRVQSVTEGWMFGLTNLEVLDLSYNQIQSFHTSSWLHTPKLKWLSLHSNRILSLPSGSFRALRQLEELILSANSIDSLHKFALIGMNNLHSLDLSSNTLAVCVEDGAVLYNTSMPFLRSLRFTNNQLRVIPKRAFERFPALEELDITDNPIATIHPEAFEPLVLKRLIMNSSSILCDCQISWFAKFIYDLQLDRTKIVAKCSYPPQFKDLDVVAIDRSNLTCLDDSPRAKIVGQPEEVNALVGERARFTCNLYGEGPILIEWRVMENDQPRVLVQDSSTFMTINTTAVINGTMEGREFAAAELILDNVALSDKSEYQCVGRNRFGSDFSKNVNLQVHQKPTFLSTPSDMSLLVGQNAKFVCSASGTPRPELKWAFDGGLFPAAEARRLYVIPNDDHIYIMNVTIHDQGVYTCHATNIAGQIQASARLRVFENVFQNTLESITIREAESTVLECFVGLIPGVQRMVWKKGQLEVQDSTRARLSADNQMLMLTKAKFSDAGEYSCELWTGSTLLSKQSAMVNVVSEEDYVEEDSVIYRKATELKAMASKWAREVNHKENRYAIITASLLIIVAMLGICISIFCCTTRCLFRRQPRRPELPPPVFV